MSDKFRTILGWIVCIAVVGIAVFFILYFMLASFADGDGAAFFFGTLVVVALAPFFFETSRKWVLEELGIKGWALVMLCASPFVWGLAGAIRPFFEGKSFVDGCLTFIGFLTVCAFVLFLRAKMGDK